MASTDDSDSDYDTDTASLTSTAPSEVQELYDVENIVAEEKGSDDET